MSLLSSCLPRTEEPKSWVWSCVVTRGVLTLWGANKHAGRAESTTATGKRRDPDRKASLCPLLMDFTGHSRSELKDRKLWHICVIHQECLVKLVRKHLLETSAVGKCQININKTNSKDFIFQL